MDLVDVWPVFGLRLFTPRLELRVARDDDIPGLAEAAIRGIHDAGAVALRARVDRRAARDAAPRDGPLLLA